MIVRAGSGSHTSPRCDCSILRTSLHGTGTKLLQEPITVDICCSLRCSAYTPSSSTWSGRRYRAASRTTATPGRMERGRSPTGSGRAPTALTAVGRRRHGRKMPPSTLGECHRQSKLVGLRNVDSSDKETAQVFIDDAPVRSVWVNVQLIVCMKVGNRPSVMHAVFVFGRGFSAGSQLTRGVLTSIVVTWMA